MENLRSFLFSLPTETQWFVAIIGMLTLYFHVVFNNRAINNGPTILTTIGIFATFFAIAHGLSAFDSSKVQQSVPSLLAALKTAFWASVIGVGGALTLKLRDQFFGHSRDRSDAKSPEDVTVADLAAHLKSIQLALADQNEGSLLSQLKLSRQDSNDRLDALRAAQTEALARMSEMGSRALVEALRDVIKDFNTRITEQFGDNFKQLNLAVGQLLVWQEGYKATVETTVSRLNEVTELSKRSTENYAALVDKAGAFTKIANDLASLLTALETEKAQLQRMSEGLAHLLKEASASLPAVEKKFVQLSQELANSVTRNQELVGSALTESTKLLTEALASNQKTLSSTLADSARQTTELVAKTKEQVTILDTALSEELRKSLESLGRQLAALSEKFVSDYTPLTDKLRQLVEVGNLGR